MHIKRWTREEMERAREQGKVLGPPWKFTGGQVEEMRRMREEGAGPGAARCRFRVFAQHGAVDVAAREDGLAVGDDQGCWKRCKKSP